MPDDDGEEKMLIGTPVHRAQKTGRSAKEEGNRGKKWKRRTGGGLEATKKKLPELRAHTVARQNNDNWTRTRA